MGENYCECLTAQRIHSRYRMITILLIALTVLLALGGLFILPLLMIPAIACGVAAWFISRRIHVEYEYLLLDHEITVDAIYGKDRRKTVMNCATNKIEYFQPAGQGQLSHLQRQNVKVEDYSAGEGGGRQYLMSGGGESGRFAALLTPSEEMLDILSRELSRAVFTR